MTKMQRIGYIRKFKDESLRNALKAEVFSRLPKSLREVIKDDPDVEKVYEVLVREVKVRK